jgi:hypothetical protein
MLYTHTHVVDQVKLTDNFFFSVYENIVSKGRNVMIKSLKSTQQVLSASHGMHLL